MRRLTLIALIPLSSLFITACTASPSIPVPTSPVPTSPVQLLTFRGGRVSFRYPATWTAHRYSVVATFFSAIVYLSNDPLHPPCRGGTCGRPIDHLGPGGVLVTWSARGFPGFSFEKATGTAITVGGHRARIQVQHPGTCGTIGGAESVAVVVERPAVPYNSWGINACIRGPNTATAEEQVRAMLRTAQFPSD